MTIEINRGINASHWLSQSDRRGQERADWFTRADVAWASWDYKGDFGIVTPDGQETGIAGILLS